MRTLIAACAALVVLATVVAFAPAPGQAADDVTAAQQQELDKIYAEAAAAGQGKTRQERLAIYRQAMPRIIEVLQPGTASGSYARVIADTPAIRTAQKSLAAGLFGGNGDVPFYP
jgi:hypothetical protein